MGEISIKGDKDLINKLNKLLSEEDIQSALGKSCALVTRNAVIKAPKDEGTLQDSITSEVEGHTGKVYTPLEYAPYVEYGTGLFAEKGNGRQDVPWHYKDDEGNWHRTSGIKPQPFLRPALQESKSDILKIFGEGINK